MRWRHCDANGSSYVFSLAECCLECLLEIVDQVLLGLDADGNADEVLGDADADALLLLDGGVGHQVGQLSQGLVAAQGLGKGDLEEEQEINIVAGWSFTLLFLTSLRAERNFLDSARPPL